MHISFALLGPTSAGEPLRAPTAGDDAEQDFRLTEHGAIAADSVVTRQRQFASTPQRIAAHRGDDEARQRGECIERGMEARR